MKYDKFLDGITNGSYMFVYDKNNHIDEFIEILKRKKTIVDQDIYFIDELKTIKIAHIREVKRKVNLSSSGKNKLLYIKKSQNMSKEASNSLLKLLEEPPKNTIIILFVDNIYKLLKTIQSRCKKIYLKNTQLEISDSLNKKVLSEILKCRYFYEKQKIIEKIIKNKINIHEMLTDWIVSLKKSNNPDYKKIKTINKYLKFYKSGINTKLMLENIIINI